MAAAVADDCYNELTMSINVSDGEEGQQLLKDLLCERGLKGASSARRPKNANSSSSRDDRSTDPSTPRSCSSHTGPHKTAFAL